MGSASPRTPVYFLSHGGPNIIYDKSHPVYPKLQEIGLEITQKVKPKAVVVFSAHWQGEPGPDVIEVNTAEKTDLIYDFYGFPASYYKAQYPHTGSPSLSSYVLSLLSKAGIKAKPANRGLDHGVWAAFSVAFNPATNPLNCPIIQVSLFNSDSASAHQALGAAVSPLRDEGVAIIVSGMAVHNLRDMRLQGERAYTKSFDEALKNAVEGEVEGRESRMEGLLERGDARSAHPTFEHLLPVYVGAGAAWEDEGKRLWTMEQGSMSWAQFRFGNVPV